MTLTPDEFCSIYGDPKVKQRSFRCPVCGEAAPCSHDDFVSMWCGVCRRHWRHAVIWHLQSLSARDLGEAAQLGRLFARRLGNGGTVSVAFESGRGIVRWSQEDGSSEKVWVYERLLAAIAAAWHWNPDAALTNPEPKSWDHCVLVADGKHGAVQQTIRLVA